MSDDESRLYRALTMLTGEAPSGHARSFFKGGPTPAQQNPILGELGWGKTITGVGIDHIRAEGGDPIGEMALKFYTTQESPGEKWGQESVSKLLAYFGVP